MQQPSRSSDNKSPWISPGVSASSSIYSVPPSALSSRPICGSCSAFPGFPNRYVSRSSFGTAEKSRRKKAASERLECAWIYFAIRHFPEPFSPQSNTGMSTIAIFSANFSNLLLASATATSSTSPSSSLRMRSSSCIY